MMPGSMLAKRVSSKAVWLRCVAAASLFVTTAGAQFRTTFCSVVGGAHVNRAAVPQGAPLTNLSLAQIAWDGSRWKGRDARGRRVQIPYAFDYDRVAELPLTLPLGFDFVGQPHFSREQVSSILKQAFGAWAGPLPAAEFPSGVVFVEFDWKPVERRGPGVRVTTITPKPFIRVSWAEGRHEDLLSHQQAMNFGPNDLAHTLLPRGEMSTEDPDRDLGGMCLRTSVSWSSDGSFGSYDIVTVAVHEIGHALGLGHSDNRSSVMYPEYSGQKRQLSDEDAAMIKLLYP